MRDVRCCFVEIFVFEGKLDGTEYREKYCSAERHVLFLCRWLGRISTHYLMLEKFECGFKLFLHLREVAFIYWGLLERSVNCFGICLVDSNFCV